jgi:ATP-dependent helicase HepA
LQPEKKFGADGLIEDLRVSWLLSFLESHRGDKVLLICADAETVDTLEQFLRVLNGVRCAAFHENMSLINRDRAAAFFADDEAGAQILLCSEIGSEGRNFQFCHHLVLFDLPAHPDLLEQRIGRLDRIGQQHDVVIHVPYYQNSAQQVLFDWYREGLNAFEQVFAAGDSIVRETGDALAACLAASEDDKKTSQLIKQTRAAADKARASLQSGRNRLLERHSFDERRAQNLLMELEEATRALELADFMEDVFDIFGLEQQPHSSDSIIVQPGNHMLYAQFPGLPEDGLTATFQRHRALGREDMAFLTWEHPMVSGALDLIINTELGNSAFCTLETDAFAAGTLLLEANFTLQCVAAGQQAISRFLPQRFQRLLVDANGRQHQQTLPANQFNKLAGRIPRATAQELIRHAREQIDVLLKQAQKAAAPLAEEIKSQALQSLQQTMAVETERLNALARVNPAIREAEIEAQAMAVQKMTDTIQSAELRLDAIRVAIVTEPGA